MNNSNIAVPFYNLLVDNDEENADKVKEYFEKQIFKDISNITKDNIKNENKENLLPPKKVEELANTVNDQCKVTVKHNSTDNTYTVKCFGVELRGTVDEKGKPTGTWTDGYRKFEHVENDEGLKFQTKQDEDGGTEPCDVTFTGFKEVKPSTFFGKITFFTKPLFLGTFTNPEPQSKNTRDYKKGTLVDYTGLAATKKSGIIKDKNGVVHWGDGISEEHYFIKKRNFNKRIKLKNLPNEQEQQNTQQKKGGPLIEETKENKNNLQIKISKKQAINEHQIGIQPQDFLNKSFTSQFTQTDDNEFNPLGKFGYQSSPKSKITEYNKLQKTHGDMIDIFTKQKVQGQTK